MELKISSPCPMRWESLTGDDRVRYCGRCRLNVYNLAEMGRDEIESIFRATKGRVCGRLYLRGDRTATLRDCPEGRFNVVRRRIRNAFVGIGVLVFALGCRSISGPDLSGLPRWAQSIASWFGQEPAYRGKATLGVMVCPRSGPGATPAPTPTVGP